MFPETAPAPERLRQREGAGTFPAAVVVARYARVSTLDQLDGFGLEDQDRVSDAWLARHPEVAVHDSYVDEAVSGALERRPETDRLVADAHRQCFNRILVPKVDRIGRTARAAYLWAWNMTASASTSSRSPKGSTPAPKRLAAVHAVRHLRRDGVATYQGTHRRRPRVHE
ncbi:recombinase family protein [Streptomyces sp. NBC_01261]|uniref:recombinase family protein n=1 Tax=Streptomyces sp. NBC_01261 TaxID=2903802 RepID=UPI003FCD2678